MKALGTKKGWFLWMTSVSATRAGKDRSGNSRPGLQDTESSGDQGGQLKHQPVQGKVEEAT